MSLNEESAKRLGQGEKQRFGKREDMMIKKFKKIFCGVELEITDMAVPKENVHYVYDGGRSRYQWITQPMWSVSANGTEYEFLLTDDEGWYDDCEVLDDIEAADIDIEAIHKWLKTSAEQVIECAIKDKSNSLIREWLTRFHNEDEGEDIEIIDVYPFGLTHVSDPYQQIAIYSHGGSTFDVNYQHDGEECEVEIQMSDISILDTQDLGCCLDKELSFEKIRQSELKEANDWEDDDDIGMSY
jgi:hypothetical protein